MAILSANRAKWGDSFIIDDGAHDGFIRLAQRSRKSFKLESTIEYAGETGLEHLDLPSETMRILRRLEPKDLEDTDLASVPQPMRWWVNTYGVHTPAALIHDRFIGDKRLLPPGVSEADIDRYFRFMLKDTGVRFLKRWIMWSATALRTRILTDGWRSWKAASVLAWTALAIAGTVGFFLSVLAGNWGLAVLLGVVAPPVFSVLWGRQWGAGLVAAWLVTPWLVPPLIITAAFLVLYAAAETALRFVLDPSRAGSEPVLFTQDEARNEKLQRRAETIEEGEISQEARAI